MRVSVGAELGFASSAPPPPAQRSPTNELKAAAFSVPTIDLIFSDARRVASAVVPEPAPSSSSPARSSPATRRRDSTCSSLSCSLDFSSPANASSANIASSTGSVTGRLAAAAPFAPAAEALAAGVAAGEAEVVGADGAAELVGAAVVHPEAASNTAAATSASGDFTSVFKTSMPIYFYDSSKPRLTRRHTRRESAGAHASAADVATIVPAGVFPSFSLENWREATPPRTVCGRPAYRKSL